MDHPDPYANVSSGDVEPGRHLGGFRFAGVRLGALLLLLIALAFEYPLVWILVFVQATLMAVGLYAAKRRSSLAAMAVALQRAAKERTRASLIGSAIHTAGHPLLQRDQRVVLALNGPELSIYGYATARPICTLWIRDIESIDLVVYDDDHVPHVGAIDNSAQALQLTFPWGDGSCTCQFRWMFKVRPIDWYHVLGSARLIEG